MRSSAIERVIVSVDAASEYRTAFDTAALLAARTGSPLHGVFVEDEELLHLARLPVVRHVAWGAAAEPFTEEFVALHLRAAAEQARRELAAAAARHALEWSFEVVRGAAAAFAGASPRDLVVTGGLTRPVAGHFRVHCRWWSSLEARSGPFLFARAAWVGTGAVVVLLHSRNPAAARLLEAAARIAEATASALVVLRPQAIADAAGFGAWVDDHLAAFSLQPQIEAQPDEPSALSRRIVELDCRLLAFEADAVDGADERLQAFADRFACDVLIIR
jgi:hypothetical protein